MLIQVFDCDANIKASWEQPSGLTDEQAIALANEDLIPMEIAGGQVIEYEFEFDFEADQISEVKRTGKAIAQSLNAVLEASESDEELSLETLFRTADEIMSKPIYQS
ncbi:MAG: hypothetical protein AAFU78_17385 [Cyanobacteria bacterium J06633_2]